MINNEPIKREGILPKNRAEKMKRGLDMIKAMQGTLEPVVKKRTRGKDKGIRQQPEAEFRKEVVKFLKRKRFYYKRIENGISGRHTGNGVPDFLFFTYNKMYWLELKSSKGRLSDEQIEFKEWCKRTNTGHIVARTIKDIEDIIYKDII